MKKIILWSLLLGLLVNVSGAPVYSSDEEKPAETTSEGGDKVDKPAEESKGEGKAEGEGEKKPAVEESKDDSKEGSDKKADKAEKSDKKAEDSDKPAVKEKPKKEKAKKPDNIKVSDECWDAMVEAKGDESGKDCKKALNPLRKKKTEDGEKAPCAGKENKKGFKKAVSTLCKKEKDE